MSAFHFMGSRKSNLFRIEGDLAWITLTQGQETCVDSRDLIFVLPYRWCAHKEGRTFYPVTNIPVNGKNSTIAMHRILIPVPGYEVDHKDRNGLNNQRKNLRVATHRQNSHNRGAQSRNKIGYKGVTWCSTKKKWVAHMSLFFGAFNSPRAAARAYDQGAKKLFGKFACLNFKNGF